MSDTAHEAIENVSEFAKRVWSGWPVYGVIVLGLWGYAELYLDKMIAEAIKTETGRTVTVSEIKSSVALNTDAVNDLENSVGKLEASVVELNGDVKAVLLHLAGED